MFEFPVSTDLVRQTLNGLPRFGYVLARYRLWRLGISLDNLSIQWGLQVVRAIGSIAHQTRYGLHAAGKDGTPGDRFIVIENGRFVEALSEYIESATCFIGADQSPMRDLARELLAHMRSKGLPEFHPRAPIKRFELTADTLIAHVHAHVPLETDPHWISATMVE